MFERTSTTMALDAGDLHHAVIVFCTNPNVPFGWKCRYALIAALSVTLQTLASTALIVNVATPRCDAPWMSCGNGLYCYDASSSMNRRWFRCMPCGGLLPSTLSSDGLPQSALTGAERAQSSWQMMLIADAVNSAPGVSWETAYLQMLRAENASGVREKLPKYCQEGRGLLATECDACYDPSSDLYTTRSDVLYGRLIYSTMFDWCMLILCTLLVASNAHKETKEVRMSSILLEAHDGAPATADDPRGGKYGDGRPLKPSAKGCCHYLWMFLLCEIASMRQFVVLPLVVTTVPLFALGMGMDALNVALNALAVLFILEVDNIMYSMLLSSKQQEYISSIEVDVNPQYDPRHKAWVVIDVAVTVCAVLVPIWVNHYGFKGAGMFASPTLEVCIFSVSLSVLLTSLVNALAAAGDVRFGRRKRFGIALFVTVLTLAHLAVVVSVLWGAIMA